jgi:hypothetical protein
MVTRDARQSEEVVRIDLSFPDSQIGGEGDDVAVADSDVGPEHGDGGGNCPSF